MDKNLQEQAENTIMNAFIEADIDGYGDEGAGYSYAVFAEYLEAHGWRFLPGLPEGENSGDKLRSLIESTISVAMAEQAFQDGTYSQLRSQIANVFYLGEVSGFTKYRKHVREWIKSFPEGY